MNIGNQVWDRYGNLILDTTDNVGRIRWAYVTGVQESDSIVLPDISPSDVAAFAVLLYPTYNGVAHGVTVTGNTVAWTARSFSFWQPGEGGNPPVEWVYEYNVSLILVVWR